MSLFQLDSYGFKCNNFFNIKNPITYEFNLIERVGNKALSYLDDNLKRIKDPDTRSYSVLYYKTRIQPFLCLTDKIETILYLNDRIDVFWTFPLAFLGLICKSVGEKLNSNGSRKKAALSILREMHALYPNSSLNLIHISHERATTSYLRKGDGLYALGSQARIWDQLVKRIKFGGVIEPKELKDCLTHPDNELFNQYDIEIEEFSRINQQFDLLKTKYNQTISS